MGKFKNPFKNPFKNTLKKFKNHLTTTTGYAKNSLKGYFKKKQNATTSLSNSGSGSGSGSNFPIPPNNVQGPASPPPHLLHSPHQPLINNNNENPRNPKNTNLSNKPSDPQKHMVNNNNIIIDPKQDKIVQIINNTNDDYTKKYFIANIFLYLDRGYDFLTYGKELHDCVYNNTFLNYNDVINKIYDCIITHKAITTNKYSTEKIKKMIESSLHYAYNVLFRSTKGGYKRKSTTRRRQRNQRK